MLINWCVKGIAAQKGFGDAEARSVLDTHGLRSTMLFHQTNIGMPVGDANENSQASLSLGALDDHVNNFANVRADTPYISLSAGCWEFAGKGVPAVHRPAMTTALDFATERGTSEGYLFRLWVYVTPQVLAELPGPAEEVRDLNLFSGFTLWHEEGEIAAKILVPRRQIQSVIKVDPQKKSIAWGGHAATGYHNPGFVPPERATNLGAFV